MPRLSVERGLAEHDALLAVAGRLRHVVAGAVAPEAADRLLREFGNGIEEHRDHEIRGVYEPLLGYAEERSAEFGSVLAGMLIDAGSDWSSYLNHWSLSRMEADWSTFAIETRRVLDRGRARLCLENELLYPLALRHGLISLRG